MPVVKDDDSTADDYNTEELNFKCLAFWKVFESNYILDYHNLLEHSKHKRPPIGIS